VASDTVSWGGRSGKVVNAGKHGVVVEANGAKHKLFWDEVESVGKAEKHGESTGATDAGAARRQEPAEPEKEHGLVGPDKAARGARGRRLEGDAQELPRILGWRHLGNERCNDAKEKDEFEKVAAHLPEYLQDAGRWAFLTGWRNGDVRNMMWTDVDTRAMTVILRRRKTGRVGRSRYLMNWWRSSDGRRRAASSARQMEPCGLWIACSTRRATAWRLP
jgi:integrase